MNGIKDFLNTYARETKAVSIALFALLAVITVIVTLSKAGPKFWKGQNGEGFKYVISGGIFLLILTVGVVGMIGMINKLSKGAGAGLFETQDINI